MQESRDKTRQHHMSEKEEIIPTVVMRKRAAAAESENHEMETEGEVKKRVKISSRNIEGEGKRMRGSVRGRTSGEPKKKK